LGWVFERTTIFSRSSIEHQNDDRKSACYSKTFNPKTRNCLTTPPPASPNAHAQKNAAIDAHHINVVLLLLWRLLLLLLWLQQWLLLWLLLLLLPCFIGIGIHKPHRAHTEQDSGTRQRDKTAGYRFLRFSLAMFKQTA